MSRRLTSLGALAAIFLASALGAPALAQPAPAAPSASESAPAPAPPPPAPAPAPSGSASKDPADELFARGNEAFDRGALDEAYGLYQKAWALKHTFDIAGNLGQVELKLGRFRDAAEHLEFTLRLFPPTGKSEPREAIRRAFEAARKQVASLTIRVNVQGAAVSIDGASIGLSPFEAPVFVEPGKRTIEATLEAHLPTRISIDVAKNESRDVALSLVPKAQPPPPPRNVPLLITGFGLSLAAAGTGIGLMVASANRGAEADSLLQKLVAGDADGKCPCGSDDDRAHLKGLRQDHDLFFNTAVGMFAAAGVLAVGSTIYVLTPSFQRPTVKSATVAPMVLDRGGGALLVGSF
jgi:tetratricopeptide (TPR) repeat protein